MRIQPVSSLLLLSGIACLATSVVLGGESPVGLPQPDPAKTELPGPQLSTNPIQRLVLDPMQVTRIPVATDRLTTVRFPSPMSDLVSALVATETHPSARFLLSFQPGESFFSLRALAPGASTTLNVVWKFQTYVLELVESRTPWLSVIMAPAEIPKVPRPIAPVVQAPPNPWAQYLDTAKAYEALKRKYPNSMPEVQVWSLGNQRDFGTYALRTDQLFHFKDEGIVVLRVTVINKIESPLSFGSDALSITLGKLRAPVLLSDFDGTVPGGAQVVAFMAFSCNPSSGVRPNLLTDPINVTLSHPHLPSGKAVLSPLPAASVSGLSATIPPRARATVMIARPASGKGPTGLCGR